MTDPDRAAFEAWAAEKWGNQAYRHTSDTSGEWEAWQAATKRTPWFPRNTPPVRQGWYECGVRLAGMPRRLVLWELEWDGKGFKVPMPMVVHQWRGLTKQSKGVA